MNRIPASDPILRLIASDRFADIARVAVSLIGVAIFCLYSGRMHAIVSIMLGVIACGLAETDDSGPRRLISLVVTLFCFAATALIVEILTDYPFLFALGLVVSTFALVMLGAIGTRWGSVATGTLILAVYTMIGMELKPTVRDLWAAPAYLTLGAAWYGLLSFAWSILAPGNALRHALADVYDALGAQVEGAAALFEPFRETDYDKIRLHLAEANAAAVSALNRSRLMLIDRLAHGRMRPLTRARLQLYFTAQDIHERIHSAHYPHDELARAFFHSDVLFRAGHLLRLQAKTLHGFAQGLRLGRNAPAPAAHTATIDDIRTALAQTADRERIPERLIEAVSALLRNVEGLQRDLENPYTADVDGQILQNPDPTTLKQAALRVWGHMTPRSGIFRHAVRLAAGLLAGYAFLRVAHLQHGFWILLTTLLVSQQGYGATRRRLAERIIGTVIGVVAGWAALQLFPDRPIQLALIVAAGTGFFVFRRRQYPAATAMITLFVILSFEQVLSGYAVIGPRLFDTFVGVAIAFAGLRFVLPDWKVRRLKDRVADMLKADGAYLQDILRQYRDGRSDDLAYRIARRDAHNAHAAFEGLVRDILSEPAHTATKTDAALRALGLAHQLLSYLSALGAHREGGILADGDPLSQCGRDLCAELMALSQRYRANVETIVPMPDMAKERDSRGTAHSAETGDTRHLITANFARMRAICTGFDAAAPVLSKE